MLCSVEALQFTMQALSSGSDEESAGAELRRAAAAYAATSKRYSFRKPGSTACASHRASASAPPLSPHGTT